MSLKNFKQFDLSGNKIQHQNLWAAIKKELRKNIELNVILQERSKINNLNFYLRKLF